MKKLLGLFVLLGMVSSVSMAGDMMLTAGMDTSTTGGPSLRMGLGSNLYGELGIAKVSLPSSGTTTYGAAIRVGYVLNSTMDSSNALAAAFNYSSVTNSNSIQVMCRHEVWLNKKLALGIQGGILTLPLASSSTITLFDSSMVYGVIAI